MQACAGFPRVGEWRNKLARAFPKLGNEETGLRGLSRSWGIEKRACVSLWCVLIPLVQNTPDLPGFVHWNHQKLAEQNQKGNKPIASVADPSSSLCLLLNVVKTVGMRGPHAQTRNLLIFALKDHPALARHANTAYFSKRNETRHKRGGTSPSDRVASAL